MNDSPVTLRGAELSACGNYRYRLWRTWDVSLPQMRFIMLNPSTADGTKDDPTIRRCMGFARREGCGGIVVVNLFALRATSPADLAGLSYGDLQGPAGIGWLSDEFNRIAMRIGTFRENVPVIAAWGSSWRPLQRWGVKPPPVLDSAASRKIPVHCLGFTRSGDPRHPLYVKGDAPLRPYDRFPL